MRDWLTTSIEDRKILEEVKNHGGIGAWRPWRGQYARAGRLCRQGFLIKAGISAMPPHVLYVITDKGSEELQVAASLPMT